jgi:hypothetical protein
MNLSTSLDKYLTTPFDDGFENYFEAVTEKLSNEFFDKNKDWVMESKQFENWIEICRNKELNPSVTSKIIQRAHRFKMYYEKLISVAHTNLTVKKGRKEYAPTSFEIQNEINKIKKQVV